MWKNDAGGWGRCAHLVASLPTERANRTGVWSLAGIDGDMAAIYHALCNQLSSACFEVLEGPIYRESNADSGATSSRTEQGAERGC